MHVTTVVRGHVPPGRRRQPRARAATAFGNRQASHAITLDGVWRSGEDYADRDIAWTRRFFAALDSYREGVYVNFLGADEAPDRIRDAYGTGVYDRLVDMKTKYDPDNVFHHNQNIRPRSERTSARRDPGPTSLPPALQGPPDRNLHYQLGGNEEARSGERP